MKPYRHVVLGCLTVLAFLAPVKFGTPVVLQSVASPPVGWLEWAFFSWPNEWAVVGIFVGLTWFFLDEQRQGAHMDALFLLPAVFLVTQAIALPRTINWQASLDTALFFAAGVLLFYAAAWYVRDGASVTRIFAGLGLATFLICVLALQQYFGGLAETRRFAAAHIDPADMPPDLALKLSSNRVFGTLVYPNALAGYLVVVFAPVLAWIWVRGRSWDTRVKWITLVCAGVLMIECLVLTGSRGGYVSFAAALLVALWCLLQNRPRRAVGWLILVLGVLGAVFWIANRAGVARLNASSVESRSDYAAGAMAIACDHPWLGTGPGTFGSIYPKYKTARTEESRTVHNNYLQMWSDSGILALAVYLALWLVALAHAFRLARQRPGDAAAVAICSGLTGWVVHGLVDFDLYVPGVAIPAFLLLGALQGLKGSRRSEAASPQALARLLMRVVCALVVIAVLWVEARNLLAGRACGRSQVVRASNPWAAWDELQQAAVWAPWNGVYHAEAGDMALQLGRFEEAIHSYQMAVACDRYHAAYHWRLARAYAADKGVTPRVVEELRQAAELNPSQSCEPPTQPCYRRDLAEAEAGRCHPTLLGVVGQRDK